MAASHFGADESVAPAVQPVLISAEEEIFESVIDPNGFHTRPDPAESDPLLGSSSTPNRRQSWLKTPSPAWSVPIALLF
jgi:hypothetical protein